MYARIQGNGRIWDIAKKRKQLQLKYISFLKGVDRKRKKEGTLVAHCILKARGPYVQL